MKKFVFAIVLLGVLVGCGIWYQCAVADFAGEISARCDAIERLVYEKESKALEENFEEIEAYWENKETQMAYFIDHAHLNAITKSIGELGMAIRVRAEADILMANARIKAEAQDIAEDELLRPENLF